MHNVRKRTRLRAAWSIAAVALLVVALVGAKLAMGQDIPVTATPAALAVELEPLTPEPEAGQVSGSLPGGAFSATSGPRPSATSTARARASRPPSTQPPVGPPLEAPLPAQPKPTPSPTTKPVAPKPSPTRTPSRTPAPEPPAPPDTEPPTGSAKIWITDVTRTSITVQWEPVTDNVGVHQYAIIRGDYNWRNWSTVGWVSGNTVTFTDTGLTPGGGYSYTVRAWDAAGNQGDDVPAPRAMTPP